MGGASLPSGVLADASGYKVVSAMVRAVGAVEKREQVFVSSTYLDLKEARQEVIQTLLEADCIPAGMELFPASDDGKWTLIRQVIDDSDYYLLIIGGRYGSVDPDRGLSFTEQEYDYAVQQSIPVMAFLHEDPGQIPSADVERSEELLARLQSFRERVEQNHVVKYWRQPADLGGQVAKALIQLRKTHPAEGWIRARDALTPEILTELEELRRHAAEYRADREGAALLGIETQSLAQGSDHFELAGDLHFWTKDQVAKGPLYAAGRHIASLWFKTTWDQVFAALGPVFLNEGSERDIREKLSGLLLELAADNPGRLPESLGRFSDLVALDESVDQVTVQLVALGLIEKSARRRSVNDRDTYWTVTALGQVHLMRLRALRRPVGEEPEPLAPTSSEA